MFRNAYVEVQLSLEGLLLTQPDFTAVELIRLHRRQPRAKDATSDVTVDSNG